MLADQLILNFQKVFFKICTFPLTDGFFREKTHYLLKGELSRVSGIPFPSDCLAWLLPDERIVQERLKYTRKHDIPTALGKKLKGDVKA